MNHLRSMLAGAIMMAALVIAAFFLRFWQKTKDPLFALFAAAFLLLGLERVTLVLTSDEMRALVYLIRLAAFLLILFAIFDKNRKRDGA